jgi:lactoylglutathione lyase
MKLATPSVDIGLYTNDLKPQLDFWRGEIGLPLESVLAVRPGVDQHRSHMPAGVLKINHCAEPLAADAPSGYRELLIAQEGLSQPRALTGPEGARLSLVPPGHDGVSQVGIRLGVRDLNAHRRFYGEGLRLPEERPGAFRAGQTLFLLEQDPSAPNDPQMSAAGGWRYITFQVTDLIAEHAAILAGGGREARPPFAFGSALKVSLVRDPDGNWIEVIQRAAPGETFG